MLEGRTVFHIFNKKLAGKVLSADGESVRIGWSDGRIYSHDRKFLCDEFSELDELNKKTVVRNDEDESEPEEESEIGVYELGVEPTEQDFEEEEVL